MSQIQIQSAFVEDVLSGPNGAFGLSTAEPHQRKNDSGQWETLARTFRTVKGGDIDYSQFQKGDRVRIFGREVTEAREYQGEKKYQLVVWADAVVKIIPRQGRGGGTQATGAPQAGDWSSAPVPSPQAAAQGDWGGSDAAPF